MRTEESMTQSIVDFPFPGDPEPSGRGPQPVHDPPAPPANAPPPAVPPPAATSPRPMRELRDLVPVLRRWVRPWIFFVATVTLMTVVAALLLPPRYKATASLMSAAGAGPQGAFGRLARLTNLAPAPEGLPVESLASILESRRIADHVLDTEMQAEPGGPTQAFRYWLTKTQPGEALNRDRLYKKLRGATHFRIDPESRIVHLALETRQPLLAANALNTYVDALSSYATVEHQSRSRAVRRFVGERIAEVETELANTEERLHRFYDKNHNYATTSDPDIQVARMRLERAVEIKSRVLLELTSQYESAQVEERNDAPFLQVIDRAAPPELRSWPRRTVMVVAAFLVASFLGFLAVLFLDARGIAPQQLARRGR